jgi:glycine cleavage system H protein
MNGFAAELAALPDDRFYAPAAELWVRFDGVEIITGATHLAASLGEFLIFTPKRVGREIGRDRALGLMELGKAVIAIHAPLSCRIVASNPAVVDDPLLVNRDPYGEGWLFRLLPTRLDEERRHLLSAFAYRVWLNIHTSPIDDD